MKTRAQQNLDYWIKMHTLPSWFPILERGTLDSEPFLREEGEELRRMIEHVQGAFRSMVLFPPGHGISTLLKEVVRRLKSSDVRLYQLFVLIDVADLKDVDDLSEALSTRIRVELFRQLAHDGWARALQGAARQQLLALFGFSEEDPLMTLQYDLRTGSSDAQKQVSEIAERWDDRLAQLYRTLFEKLGLSVTLCFDFDHKASDDLVLEIFREEKWFDENEKGQDFPPAALREAYFLTRRQASLRGSVWTVTFSEFEVRPYSRGEIFSILSHHFRPTSGTRPYQLINALSQSYIARVWREGVPLTEISKQLKEALLRDLDIPRSAVTYQLEPSDRT